MRRLILPHQMEEGNNILKNEVIGHEKTEERSVCVASIQTSSVIGDTPRNVKKLKSLIRRASDRGSKIIVLPECSITGYLSEDFKVNYRLPERPMEKCFEKSVDPTNHALTIDSPAIKEFLQLSKDLGVYITLPFVEKETDEEMKSRKKKEEEEMKEKKVPVTKRYENKSYLFFNTIVLACPEGRVAGHYRKIYPWWYPEKSWASAGKKTVVVDTAYGKIGLAVCFDIHEILKLYKSENLWSLLYCIAWVDDDTSYWFKTQLPEHLRKNDVDYHLLACNWSVDKDYDHYEGYGHTHVYDKNQRVIGKATTNVGTEIIYSRAKY